MSASELEKAMILSGIASLKTASNNKAADILEKQLHDNLELYALITSAGKPSKNSMIELFPDIAMQLGYFVKENAETSEFYSGLFSDIRTMLPLMTNTVPFFV